MGDAISAQFAGRLLRYARALKKLKVSLKVFAALAVLYALQMVDVGVIKFKVHHGVSRCAYKLVVANFTRAIFGSCFARITIIRGATDPPVHLPTPLHTSK